MTWKEYATGLEDRLADLHGRVHRGAYQAQPSKRRWMPKPNGKQRPLGIPTIRDRVAQTVCVLVLDPIFEADMPPEQYAYRLGHSALDAVQQVSPAGAQRA